jgi:hypothetical protein
MKPKKATFQKSENLVNDIPESQIVCISEESRSEGNSIYTGPDVGVLDSPLPCTPFE